MSLWMPLIAQRATAGIGGGREERRTAVRTFLDSNILLYAVDKADPSRRQTARTVLKDLVKSGLGLVSTQVAQEFFVIATKKLGVGPLAAKRVVNMLGPHNITTNSGGYLS